MLLQEIFDEDAAPGELRVLAKTFPNTWRKMVDRLIGKPHYLKFRGFDIYDESGFGPAIDGLKHYFAEKVKKKMVDVEVDFKLSSTYSEMVPISEANLVAVFYDVRYDSILLGYDAWVDDEDFGQVFERLFEEETGEVFDYENEEHELAFRIAAREFSRVGMFGLLISCGYDGMKPMYEVQYEAEKGFFKGVSSTIDRMDVIKL